MIKAIKSNGERGILKSLNEYDPSSIKVISITQEDGEYCAFVQILEHDGSSKEAAKKAYSDHEKKKSLTKQEYLSEAISNVSHGDWVYLRFSEGPNVYERYCKLKSIYRINKNGTFKITALSFSNYYISNGLKHNWIDLGMKDEIKIKVENIDGIGKASHSKIQELLEAVAKQKGFSNDINDYPARVEIRKGNNEFHYHHIDHSSKSTKPFYSCHYEMESDTLYLLNVPIYKNGTWNKFVKLEGPQSVGPEKVGRFFGLPIYKSGDLYEFGCSQEHGYTLSELEDFENSLDAFIKEGKDVSIKIFHRDLKKLIERLK